MDPCGTYGNCNCKIRAMEVMFWPNMNGEIEEMVSSCPTCFQFRISNAPKEIMISHEFPEFLWKVVAADIPITTITINFQPRYRLRAQVLVQSTNVH